MIAIRPAARTDLDAVMVLLKMMHAECRNEFPAPDRTRFAAFLDLALTRPDLALVALAVETTTVGLITGVCGDYAFSSERRATVDLFFVTAAHRSPSVANRLLATFEHWGRVAGARRIFLGSMTGIAPVAFGRLLRRRGYEPLGTVYSRQSPEGV
jgi:hypothetical protein